MKSYKTYNGAVKAGNPGDVIIRVLDDPQELFIPVRPTRTELMIYDPMDNMGSSPLHPPRFNENVFELTKDKPQ